MVNWEHKWRHTWFTLVCSVYILYIHSMFMQANIIEYSCAKNIDDSQLKWRKKRWMFDDSRSSICSLNAAYIFDKYCSQQTNVTSENEIYVYSRFLIRCLSLSLFGLSGVVSKKMKWSEVENETLALLKADRMKHLNYHLNTINNNIHSAQQVN